MHKITRTTLACGSIIRAYNPLSCEQHTAAEWIDLCRAQGGCVGLTEAQLEEMFVFTDAGVETGLVKSRQLMLSLMKTNELKRVAHIYYSPHYTPRKWTVHSKKSCVAGMFAPSCILVVARE